jgi:DNA-binding transcriptional LysR family regulator
MDLDTIKIFISTYQIKSFTLVAKELNLAPSSVSRSISVLERELKVRLFQRTTRKLTPTQEGELYYCRVLPLIEEFERLEQDLQLTTSMPSGKIRVTASTSFGQIVLAPLLKIFHRDYPSITIELILSDSHLDIVSEQIDIAIRHGALSDSSLIARKLKDVKYSLVATPQFLVSSNEIKTPRDISQYPLIAFTYKGFIKQWYFKKGSQIECVNIQPEIAITSASAIRECVRSNFGIGMLADWTIEKDIQSGNLVRVLPDWSVSNNDESASIWLIQPSRHFVSEKVKVFKEFLFKYC